MENASKALTMAVSVLIALMIISLVVYMFSTIAKSTGEEEKNKRTKQIVAFNEEYESFNRKDVYGSQLLSLVNKMANYNTKESDALGYLRMDFVVEFIVDKDGLFVARTIKNIDEFNQLVEKAQKEQEAVEALGEVSRNDYLAFTALKRKLFKCKRVDYDNDTGRLVKMYFEEVKTAM